jgi:hypothetical protein
MGADEEETLAQLKAHRRELVDPRIGEHPRCGPPMTLGNAAAARVRLIVWCKACGHRAEGKKAENVAGLSPAKG